MFLNQYYTFVPQLISHICSSTYVTHLFVNQYNICFSTHVTHLLMNKYHTCIPQPISHNFDQPNEYDTSFVPQLISHVISCSTNMSCHFFGITLCVLFLYAGQLTSGAKWCKFIMT